MHPEVLDKPQQEIFPKLGKFKEFYLAGGTALALQIGHRKSVDFDLFSAKEISKSLLSKTKRVFQGQNTEILVNSPQELTILVDGIKITFLYYPFAVIESLVKVGKIQALNVREIAATKAYTVGRRGSLKDYVDLYFVLKLGIVGLGDIVRLAKNKFKDEFNQRLFLEQLLYLDDVDDEPITFSKEKVDKQQISRLFRKRIQAFDF